MMGSGLSSLDERMFCCTQNTIYDDQQLSALATYTEQLGLDKKQLALLQKTWKDISTEMEAQGVRLFVEIFQSNNEVIHVFPSLNPNLKGNRANEVIHEAFKNMEAKLLPESMRFFT